MDVEKSYVYILYSFFLNKGKNDKRDSNQICIDILYYLYSRSYLWCKIVLSFMYMSMSIFVIENG